MATDTKNNKRADTENKISFLHSSAAEQSVLGLVLDNVSLISNSKLTEEDFYTPIHRLIWRCLGDATDGVDLILLADELHKKSDDLASSDKILDFLIQLVDGSSSSDNAAMEEHAAVILDHSVNRKLYKASRELEALSVSQIPSAEKFAQIEDTLARARELTTIKVSRSVFDAATEFVDGLKTSGTAGLGVPTGYPALDSIITSMMPGDLIVLAGRPGMGKTSLAMNIAERVGSRENNASGVFSFEMKDTQLAMRTLAGLGSVSSKSMRSGDLDDSEWKSVDVALNRAKALRLFVDDVAGCSPSELRLRVKRMIARHGQLTALVVDYVQLMHKSESRMSEQEAISEYSRTLKGIGKEFGFPVIALSQLSRDVEKRVDKRPMPSDLRGSGALEQDADLILFVYRDEVYNKDSLEPGIAEVIVGKNRSGPIGTAKLKFNGIYTSFHDLSESDDFDPMSVPF